MKITPDKEAALKIQKMERYQLWFEIYKRWVVIRNGQGVTGQLQKEYGVCRNTVLNAISYYLKKESE